MPQLDIAFFPSQIFWLILAFALLYFYCARKGLPQIEKVISARLSDIETNTRLAQTLQDQAKDLSNSCKVESETTNQGIVLMHEQMLKELSLHKERRLNKLNEDFHKAHDSAMSEIIEAKALAAKDITEITISYTSFIISKITGHKPDVSKIAACYKELNL